MVSDQWILSPTVVNQARFNYTLNEFGNQSSIRTSWPDFGSKVTLGALPARPPQIFVNGYWQAGTYGDQTQPQRNFGLSEDTLAGAGNAYREAGRLSAMESLPRGGQLAGRGASPLHRIGDQECPSRLSSRRGQYLPPEQRIESRFSADQFVALRSRRLEGIPASYAKSRPAVGTESSLYQRGRPTWNVPLWTTICAHSEGSAGTAVPGRSRYSRRRCADNLYEFRSSRRFRVRCFREWEKPRFAQVMASSMP